MALRILLALPILLGYVMLCYGESKGGDCVEVICTAEVNHENEQDEVDGTK